MVGRNPGPFLARARGARPTAAERHPHCRAVRMYAHCPRCARVVNCQQRLTRGALVVHARRMRQHSRASLPLGARAQGKHVRCSSQVPEEGRLGTAVGRPHDGAAQEEVQGAALSDNGPPVSGAPAACSSLARPENGVLRVLRLVGPLSCLARPIPCALALGHHAGEVSAGDPRLEAQQRLPR